MAKIGLNHRLSVAKNLKAENFNLKLVSTKSFSKIVKLSYDMQY